MAKMAGKSGLLIIAVLVCLIHVNHAQQTLSSITCPMSCSPTEVCRLGARCSNCTETRPLCLPSQLVEEMINTYTFDESFCGSGGVVVFGSDAPVQLHPYPCLANASCPDMSGCKTNQQDGERYCCANVSSEVVTSTAKPTDIMTQSPGLSKGTTTPSTSAAAETARTSLKCGCPSIGECRMLSPCKECANLFLGCVLKSDVDDVFRKNRFREDFCGTQGVVLYDYQSINLLPLKCSENRTCPDMAECKTSYSDGQDYCCAAPDPEPQRRKRRSAPQQRGPNPTFPPYVTDQNQTFSMAVGFTTLIPFTTVNTTQPIGQKAVDNGAAQSRKKRSYLVGKAIKTRKEKEPQRRKRRNISQRAGVTMTFPPYVTDGNQTFSMAVGLTTLIPFTTRNTTKPNGQKAQSRRRRSYWGETPIKSRLQKGLLRRKRQLVSQQKDDAGKNITDSTLTFPPYVTDENQTFSMAVGFTTLIPFTTINTTQPTGQETVHNGAAQSRKKRSYWVDKAIKTLREKGLQRRRRREVSQQSGQSLTFPPYVTDENQTFSMAVGFTTLIPFTTINTTQPIGQETVNNGTAPSRKKRSYWGTEAIKSRTEKGPRRRKRREVSQETDPNLTFPPYVTDENQTFSMAVGFTTLIPFTTMNTTQPVDQKAVDNSTAQTLQTYFGVARAIRKKAEKASERRKSRNVPKQTEDAGKNMTSASLTFPPYVTDENQTFSMAVGFTTLIPFTTMNTTQSVGQKDMDNGTAHSRKKRSYWGDEAIETKAEKMKPDCMLVQIHSTNLVWNSKVLTPPISKRLPNPAKSVISKVVLLKQISKEKCTKDRTFLVMERILLVRGGCSALFRVCFKPSNGPMKKSEAMFKEHYVPGTLTTAAATTSAPYLPTTKPPQQTVAPTRAPAGRIICRNVILRSSLYRVAATGIPSDGPITSMNLVRQLSGRRCVDGVNFDFNGPIAMAMQGCRGEFQVCQGQATSAAPSAVTTAEPSTSVTTESETTGCHKLGVKSSKEKPVIRKVIRDRNGDIVTVTSVTLLEEFSSNKCIEQNTFFYHDTQIFVTGRCFGFFLVCFKKRSKTQPPPSPTPTTPTVVSTTNKPSCKIVHLKSTPKYPDVRVILNSSYQEAKILSVTLIKEESKNLCKFKTGYFVQHSSLIARQGCAGTFIVCFELPRDEGNGRTHIDTGGSQTPGIAISTVASSTESTNSGNSLRATTPDVFGNSSVSTSNPMTTESTNSSVTPTNGSLTQETTINITVTTATMGTKVNTNATASPTGQTQTNVADVNSTAPTPNDGNNSTAAATTSNVSETTKVTSVGPQNTTPTTTEMNATTTPTGQTQTNVVNVTSTASTPIVRNDSTAASFTSNVSEASKATSDGQKSTSPNGIDTYTNVTTASTGQTKTNVVIVTSTAPTPINGNNSTAAATNLTETTKVTSVGPQNTTPTTTEKNINATITPIKIDANTNVTTPLTGQTQTNFVNVTSKASTPIVRNNSTTAATTSNVSETSKATSVGPKSTTPYTIDTNTNVTTSPTNQTQTNVVNVTPTASTPIDENNSTAAATNVSETTKATSVPPTATAFSGTETNTVANVTVETTVAMQTNLTTPVGQTQTNVVDITPSVPTPTTGNTTSAASTSSVPQMTNMTEAKSTTATLKNGTNKSNESNTTALVNQSIAMLMPNSTTSTTAPNTILTTPTTTAGPPSYLTCMTIGLTSTSSTADVLMVKDNSMIPADIQYMELVSNATSNGLCEKDQTFRYMGSVIVADGGCAAAFEVCFLDSECTQKDLLSGAADEAATYTIEGENGELVDIRSVTVVTQIGALECKEWESFFFTGDKIIVRDGCHARFRICYVILPTIL